MALMHSPKLSRRTQYLGEYLRYFNCFAPNLSKLAILVTARHWNCEYAWHYHEPDALGVTAIAELTSLSGYYTMMAITLNEHRVPLPAGAEAQLTE